MELQWPEFVKNAFILTASINLEFFLEIFYIICTRSLFTATTPVIILYACLENFALNLEIQNHVLTHLVTHGYYENACERYSVVFGRKLTFRNQLETKQKHPSHYTDGRELPPAWP